MLSAKKVERATKPGRYPCGLVRGLLPQVTESGAKSWVLRYQLNGRERWLLGLGSAADFSLKEARSELELPDNCLLTVLIPVEQKQAAQSAARLRRRPQADFPRSRQPLFRPERRALAQCQSSAAVSRHAQSSRLPYPWRHGCGSNRDGRRAARP